MKTLIGAISGFFIVAVFISLAYGFSVEGQTRINNTGMFKVNANASAANNPAEGIYDEERYQLDVFGHGGQVSVYNSFSSEDAMIETSIAHAPDPADTGSHINMTEKVGTTRVSEENCCAGAGGSSFNTYGGLEMASSGDMVFGLYGVGAQGSGRFNVAAVEHQVGDGIHGIAIYNFDQRGNGDFSLNHAFEFGCGGPSTEAGPPDMDLGSKLVLCPWDAAKDQGVGSLFGGNIVP